MLSRTGLPRFTQSLSCSFRCIWSHSEFCRFTHSHPDSLKLFQIHSGSLCPTHNHAFLFRFTQTYPDSPNLRQIHLISFRSKQSRSDPFRFASSHSGSLSLTPIYSVSLRFTELCFLSDWDHIQILSDSFILAQIHSDLLRLSQMRSIWFSVTLDSDQFRSSKTHWFSFSFTQTDPDWLRLVQCDLDFFRCAQPHSD